jgi:hypothetical protein
MEKEIPISEARVKECEESARFWAKNLGFYAQTMRQRADNFAIISAILSGVTGLAVWTTIAASTKWPAILVVSLVSISSSIVGVIPQIKKYGECAESAACLAPRYGNVLGKLTDALATFHNGHSHENELVEAVVKEFEAIKADKDKLKPLPTKLQAEIDAIRKTKTTEQPLP